jgi:lactate dehydrogenase-like 2-hydroxyacid dehydrogenase
MTDPSRPAVAAVFALRKSTQERLGQQYRFVPAFRNPVEDLAASGMAGEVRALISIGAIGTGPDVLEMLPRLELVCTFGAGYERIDLPALRRRGIALANARGANAPCVADMAMGLLLATVLRILPADRYVRDGLWNQIPPRGWAATPGFGGRRLGIFGLGEIGQRIAARAGAFDLEIGYHNRTPKAGVPYRYFDSLRAMAEWSDYLVIACPLSDATFHAVDAAVIEALGPAGTIVNIGRGAVVDQAALIAALRENRLAGAGLDVMEGEPAVPADLRALPNVVLTPHIASVTERGVTMLEDMLIANLAAQFSGGVPPGLVANG